MTFHKKCIRGHNMRMVPYLYSHCRDTMILKSIHMYNGISHTRATASSYYNGSPYYRKIPICYLMAGYLFGCIRCIGRAHGLAIRNIGFWLRMQLTMSLVTGHNISQLDSMIKKRSQGFLVLCLLGRMPKKKTNILRVAGPLGNINIVAKF